MSPTVEPENPGTDVLGKYVSALQSGVSVDDHEVTGTLKYVTGYTGFSGKTEEQSGNYLVLRFDTDDVDDVITVELLGGTVGHPVELDSDRNCVFRITNPKKQKIRVVTTHEVDAETHATVTSTEIFYLHQLELEAAE